MLVNNPDGLLVINPYTVSEGRQPVVFDNLNDCDNAGMSIAVRSNNSNNLNIVNYKCIKVEK